MKESLLRGKDNNRPSVGKDTANAVVSTDSPVKQTSHIANGLPSNGVSPQLHVKASKEVRLNSVSSSTHDIQNHSVVGDLGSLKVDMNHLDRRCCSPDTQCLA